MGRKPREPAGAFTSYENFQYLLAELEWVVASGTISWSAETAEAARLRLDRLAAALQLAASLLKGKQPIRIDRGPKL